MKRALTAAVWIALIGGGAYVLSTNESARDFIVSFLPNRLTDNAVQTDVEKQMVSVYLVDIGSKTGKGKIGVGCGDAVVPVKKTVQTAGTPPVAALAALLSLKDSYVQTADGIEYYNALYQSKLSIISVTVSDGEATVKLSGKVVSGGACDSPRIEAQLKNAVEQFPDIVSSRIFINNMPLEAQLSAQPIL